MAIKAIHRGARISARKVRPLADLVRGMYADEALSVLKFQPQRGARLLEQVIKSAVGNAQDPDQNKGVSNLVEDLMLVDVQIGEGRMFKRIRPRARGMAFMIKKRSCHISVRLESIQNL